MFKEYYRLTKPGIIYGNLMTAGAGFLLASDGHIDFRLMLLTLAGIALVIACGCVLNNYIDRDIDKKMIRTAKRALVTGAISGHSAIIFACLLGTSGLWLLASHVNSLTAFLGIVALFAYVVVYGVAKRRSVHGTLVGSIAGSMPLVSGYVAVVGLIDEGAVLLFLILAAWQMPHFYSISVFRQKDYAAAGLPVLPVVKGVKAAKQQMLVYILIFALTCLILSLRGYTGVIYAVVMVLVSLGWLKLSLDGFKAKDNVAWARKLFGFSLIVLMTFSLMISIDSWLY